MKKRNITLYTVIGNQARIPEAIKKHFNPVAKEYDEKDKQLTLILQDDTEMTFFFNHSNTNPQFVSNHQTGMANYFAQAETKHEDIKKNIIYQIQYFNSITGITFEENEDQNRTNYIINTMFAIANEIKGFLLFPAMEIYNGTGELVFSIKGETELEKFSPIANADYLDTNRPEDTEADKARQRHSIEKLKEKGIPYASHLRSSITEAEAQIRMPEEILKRLASLFAVSVYSEVMLSEEGSRENALEYIDEVKKRYPISLSPAETAYIDNESPEKNECVQFVWRYECCTVLLWALGLDKLNYPDEICDVRGIASILWNHTLDSLQEKIRMRGKDEILDEADLILRYNWACVDARIHGKETPASLESGVVQERHYVFNWLTGANNQAEWDDIQPNT